VPPLTRPMCSSIADGAAAVLLLSDSLAAGLGIRGPRVLGISAAAGQSTQRTDAATPVELAAASAYELASLGPDEIDIAEVHDAAAPAELELVERLGFVAAGDAPGLVRAGALGISGTQPVNPSGGLVGRGHPIGATGVAQIVEVADQLRGRCGNRQVVGARIGLTENAGGLLGSAPAACVVTILGSM
jgi:acetyl-CoA acetyltransferase